MGVPKLLQHLGPLLRTTNLYSAAEGKCIGVDGHVWLHQFAYHWAEDIVFHKNYEPLAREFVQQAQYALGQGVELVFVFDGAPTPAKRCTDQERQRRRAMALAKVMHGEDVTPSTAAIKAAISLGWSAVAAVVRLLRQHGIKYFIAPYEADSQLALLAKAGVVWAVATVDADFIVHGIERVFFRVSWRSGRAAMWDYYVAENSQAWPNEEKWKTDFLTMVARCGLGYIVEVAENTRTILDDAFSRVMEMTRLVGFAYHDNTEATMPRTTHGGSQRSVYFRFMAPASQRMGAAHKCWLECLVAKFPGGHPFATKVVGGGCDCPLGQTTECVHILIGEIYDVRTPLASIPFMRVKHKKSKRGKKSSGQPERRRILQVRHYSATVIA
eukprot:jgi/Tetstr1/455422/TSEL_042254.t1